MNTRPLAQPAALVRNAAHDDFEAIQEIYAREVLEGTASFEIVPPDVAEMRRRWTTFIGDGLPYLIAEAEGEVRGFAYATPYRPRLAYRYAVEDSIYVAAGWARRGIGTLLIETLIDRCTALGRRQMIAVIGDSQNAASIGFHAKHGFRLSGTLPAVGYKFGRWIDSVLMTRALGEGDRSPPDAA